ncbi:major facilitator superfamily domain-containing protein [Aspergillus ambiguus]|uniref:major facilitator superfamily domain-containing protein n=1 Tax=Aspergillus ambiguus TaxID=176160 RepID=UPI003CCD2534
MASANEDIDAQWPPGTVRIEGRCDPNDPLVSVISPEICVSTNSRPLQNWSIWRKHLNFALASYYVIMVFALIDVATVTWGPVNAELGFSFAILNDSYAAGCGSLCIGGVILIPFALKYGRRPIYVLSTAFQCGISVWTARMMNVADLMLVNILSCFVGALAEVLVQMTIADIYFVHQRGLMNGIYVWFMNVGTSLSPLAGGYIVNSQGWRWVWWWMVILFGVGLVAFVFLYEETKFINPAIEGIAVSRAPENTNHGEKRSQADANDTKAEPNIQKSDDAPKNPDMPVTIDRSIPEKTYGSKLALWTTSPGSLSSFLRYSYEAFWILFTIPAVFYMAVVYGAMTAAVTVTVTTLSSWMTIAPYNFNAAQIGLMGIPPFVGTSLAILIAGPLSDKLILVLARRNNGIYEPEMRLWISLGFTPFVPAGLLMFGIGLNNGLPWPVPAVGLAISSFGATPPSSMALTYLTDAYTGIVAGALVGVTFIRNLISTIFVFALAPWIASSGLTGFYIAFSVILTAILLVHILFICYGKGIRAMTARKYRYFTGRQIDLRE